MRKGKDLDPYLWLMDQGPKNIRILFRIRIPKTDSQINWWMCTLRSEQQRENTVRAFRSGGIWVLICTELMGRGIDFKGVNLVINYDFPPTAVSGFQGGINR